jgi:hypothetical protein
VLPAADLTSFVLLDLGVLEDRRAIEERVPERNPPLEGRAFEASLALELCAPEVGALLEGGPPKEGLVEDGLREVDRVRERCALEVRRAEDAAALL